jgi:hypothetical protein
VLFGEDARSTRASLSSFSSLSPFFFWLCAVSIRFFSSIVHPTSVLLQFRQPRGLRESGTAAAQAGSCGCAADDDQRSEDWKT